MSDHEDELRRNLGDPRWELPVAEDAEARIRRAARRDHRMRIVGAMALILVLGTAAGGYGLSRQSRSLHVVTPAQRSTGSPAVTPTVTPSPTANSSPQSVAAAGAPAGFQAASVTFVSASDGWVLGASCSTCNVAIVHTTDGGKTWTAIPAPAVALAEASDANSGVSTIRFADPSNGWLFGPELWSTHDGGATWIQPNAPGLSSGGSIVDALEVANGLVTTVVLNGGLFTIDTSTVGADAWRASPTTIQSGAGPVAGAQVVVHGAAGWIIENDRVVGGGARLVNGAWQPWTPPCVSGGGPALLAASSSSNIDALCAEGVWTGSTVGEYLYRSTDGGGSFSQSGSQLPFATLQALALAPGTPTLVASGYGTTQELVASFDGGATWATVYQGPAAASELKDLGFTTASQGVAVEGVNGPLGSLLMTFDGGHSWKPVAFSSAVAPSPPAAKPTPSPQPSPTLPASGLPTIGSPGWPASIYAPSVTTTGKGDLTACPNPANLEPFTPSVQSSAIQVAKGYRHGTELSDLEHTDPSDWSGVASFRAPTDPGLGQLGQQEVVQSEPAGQSGYSIIVSASCGSPVVAESFEVTVGPQQSPGPDQCAACNSQLFFVNRNGTPLVYFSY